MHDGIWNACLLVRFLKQQKRPVWFGDKQTSLHSKADGHAPPVFTSMAIRVPLQNRHPTAPPK